MAAIQDVEAKTNLVSFMPEKWNEEYNIRAGGTQTI
jgi:antitoxin YefM